MSKPLVQINNLRIYQAQDYGYRFRIRTPDGKILAECRYLNDAKTICKDTKTYLKSKSAKV